MARLKNIPGAKEIVRESGFVVSDPEQYKGKWKSVFGNDHPIELEIGIGKGRFLMDLAERFPGKNFLGMELYSSVLFRAMQKAEQRVTGAEKPLPVTEKERPACPADCNFRLLRYDATELTSLFEKGEIDRIYLNFSDPWPKDRHADRRLTSTRFLERYEKILKPGQGIVFKTDNQELFAFSLEALREKNWELLFYTFDLHESGNADGNDVRISDGKENANADGARVASKTEVRRRQQENIMTEYEEKFSSAGHPICMLEAVIPVVLF